MSELIARTGQIEGRVKGQDIHTARLAANPAVSLPPEFGFAGYFSDELLDVFADYADDFKALVYDRKKDYPNANLMPAYQPADVAPHRLPFLAVWGDRTEFPHPRTHMLPHYFGRLALMRARMHRDSLVRLTLNATGLVGYFYEVENGINARVAHGIHNGRISFIDFQNLNRVTTVEALSESLAEARRHRPLSFKAGIRHHTNNGYVGNVFDWYSHHNVFNRL